MWLRDVDDKTHHYAVDSLSHYINSIDPHIKFTIEPEIIDKLPFLDLCVNVMDDGGTKITDLQEKNKPTQT